jgi:hypothetical protein
LDPYYAHFELAIYKLDQLGFMKELALELAV